MSEVKRVLAVTKPGLQMSCSKSPTITCKTQDTDKRVYVTLDEDLQRQFCIKQNELEKSQLTSAPLTLNSPPALAWGWTDTLENAAKSQIGLKHVRLERHLGARNGQYPAVWSTIFECHQIVLCW